MRVNVVLSSIDLLPPDLRSMMAHDTGAFLPPYCSPEAAFQKQLRGSCHCGRVVYWLRTNKPLASKFCHCGDCQRLHGAPFQWAAILHKTDMALETGTKGLHFYHAASCVEKHELPCKVSCSYCATPIMDEGRRMVLLFPTLLSFRDDQEQHNFDVQCHLFYNQRVLDIPDGKPKWAGLDGKSALLDLP